MWEQLMKNQVLVSSVTGWVVAQFLKTIIDCMLNKSFSPERLVGSGGMPSSHSSTVCALVVSSGLCFGVSSFEFAVSFRCCCNAGSQTENGMEAGIVGPVRCGRDLCISRASASSGASGKACSSRR